MSHTIRTTIRPHEEITVSDQEYTDLKRQGLVKSEKKEKEETDGTHGN